MSSSDYVLIGIAFAGMIGSTLVGYIRMVIRIALLESKVETMWAFQIRRAASEVVNTKLGEMNSPLKIKASAKQYLDPIKAELKRNWTNDWQKLSTLDALLEIERVFGNKLLTLICTPCQLSHGACLLVALSVASDRDAIMEFPG